MLEKLRPPIAQKPLDESGYFSVVWSRFFLSLSLGIEENQNASAPQTSNAGDISDLATSVTDLTLKCLLLVSEGVLCQKKIDDLQQHIILLESDYQSQITDLKCEITDINRQLPFFGIREA